MLSFAPNTVSVETLLANTNALLYFTPNASTNNSLIITKDGLIKVVNKLLGELIEEGALASREKTRAFAQEKMILLWHFSQLYPYLQKRFREINKFPKNNLHQYYDSCTSFQGFYQLCHQLKSLLDVYYQLMKNEEMLHESTWTLEFKLLQQYLDHDMDALIININDFLRKITEAWRNFSTVKKISTKSFSITTIHSFTLQLELEIPIRKSPCFIIGQVNLEDQQFPIKASFEMIQHSLDTSTISPFSGKFNIAVQDADGIEHCVFKIYPSWSYSSQPKPQPTKKITYAVDTAIGYLKECFTTNSSGKIPLQPVTLTASIARICDHVTTEELLPYFIAMVDVAQRQNITDIIFYAPYNYSAILYAYGFYITQSDVEHPTEAEQQDVVKDSMFNGQEVPRLSEDLNKSSEDNDPIFRPFCFTLRELATRAVYLTHKKRTTTYAKLLKSTSIMNADDYPQEVFPEVGKIPLSFQGPLYKRIPKRELTGKLEVPALYYNMEPVDYRRLANDKALQEVAFADTEKAEQSGFKQMLTLRRS